MRMLDFYCHKAFRLLVAPLALFLCCIHGENSSAASLERNPMAAGYRGINMSLQSRPTDAVLDKFSRWGINLVRLEILTNHFDNRKKTVYLDDGKSYREELFRELDSFLDMARERQIKVIIATPDFPGSRNKLFWTDFGYWEKLEDLWIYIANRYKNHEAVLGYHPIDEPNLVLEYGRVGDRLRMRSGLWTFPAEWTNTPKDYFLLVEKIGQAINKIDPRKIIVISGFGLWGFTINYSWMRPVNARNVVYSFNPFIPSAFANSGKKGRPIVGYSSVRERSTLVSQMRPVQDFANKYKANIIVVGFGLPVYTEGMGAKEWMQDMLGFFEENKWSWTYFSYSVPFRNPELVRLKDGTLEKHENTERLTVLKEYWARNKKSPEIMKRQR